MESSVLSTFIFCFDVIVSIHELVPHIMYIDFFFYLL